VARALARRRRCNCCSTGPSLRYDQQVSSSASSRQMRTGSAWPARRGACAFDAKACTAAAAMASSSASMWVQPAVPPSLSRSALRKPWPTDRPTSRWKLGLTSAQPL
jgi:hypothetical protein